MKAKIWACLIFILLTVIIVGHFLMASPSGYSALVTQVVDGDTITVQGGERVRLLGIDAPEEGEPWYQESRDWLREKILHKQVWLERDEIDEDRWGRSLRWVWLNGELINVAVVRAGWAIAKRYDRIKYQELIAQAETEAIQTGLGVWADYEGAETDCVALGCPDGTQLVGSERSDKYHRCGCVWADKIRKENLICFNSTAEAVAAGYTPCSVCNP